VTRKSAPLAVRSLPLELPFLRAAGFLFLLVLFASPAAFSDKGVTPGEGFSIDVPTPEADVLTAVQALVDDHIVHGTYIYEREKNAQRGIR